MTGEIPSLPPDFQSSGVARLAGGRVDVRLGGHKNGAAPEAAFYPLIELPTGNRQRGLGAGFFRAFPPFWIGKNLGDWLTCGGGYWLNQNKGYGDRNYS